MTHQYESHTTKVLRWIEEVGVELQEDPEYVTRTNPDGAEYDQYRAVSEEFERALTSRWSIDRIEREH